MAAPEPDLAKALGLSPQEALYGPARFVKLVPTREQDELSMKLAREALEPLRAALAERTFTLELSNVHDGRTLTARRTIGPGDVPAELDELAYLFGLPLSGSAWPDGLEEAGLLAIERLNPEHRKDGATTRLRARFATELVARECHLWDVAGKHGAESHALPFAARIRALRWWYEPQASREPALVVCARCGELDVSHAEREGATFCHFCIRTPRLKLPRAVMPAHRVKRRFTWWLSCAECGEPFPGSAQARFCPPHRSARRSKRQRQAR